MTISATQPTSEYVDVDAHASKDGVAECKLTVEAHLKYSAEPATDILLQIEVADTAGQKVNHSDFNVIQGRLTGHVSAEEEIGRRTWIATDNEFECIYRADLHINRTKPDFQSLNADPVSKLPSEVVKYLMPSRYCDVGDFGELFTEEFANLSGGDLIQTISHWIKNNFEYDIFASDSRTTASNTLKCRAGVCRDYAHVLITLARSVAIPARMASVYAPDVKPQDFHAVTQVYLQGEWHLIDPTGMASADQMAIIGVGRDAADVSFMTSYGFVNLEKQTVSVERV